MKNNILGLIIVLITFSCDQSINYDACNPRSLIKSKTNHVFEEDSLILSINTLKNIKNAYVINYSKRNYFSRYIIGNQILITRKLSNDSTMDLTNKFILKENKIKLKIGTCYAVNRYLNTSYNLRKDIYSPPFYKMLMVEGLQINDEIRIKDTIYLGGKIVNLALGNDPSEMDEVMLFNENEMITKPVPFEMIIVKRKTGLFLHILYQKERKQEKKGLRLLNLLRNNK